MRVWCITIQCIFLQSIDLPTNALNKVQYVTVIKTPTCFGGALGGVVVKELWYKSAGRGFDSRWCHWNFSLT